MRLISVPIDTELNVASEKCSKRRPYFNALLSYDVKRKTIFWDTGVPVVLKGLRKFYLCFEANLGTNRLGIKRSIRKCPKRRPYLNALLSYDVKRKTSFFGAPMSLWC